MSRPLRDVVRAAEAELAAAGISSARTDAVLLLAHVLDVGRGEVERRLLLGSDLDAAAAGRLEGLVAERARRVPLQHLTGAAPFRHLELAVGPGVFVPRPETELAVDLVLAELSRREGEGGGAPVVVDLCTGSGALALAVADEAPGAEVVAVELSPEAVAWARHNVERTGLSVRVVEGDASADPRSIEEVADLVGTVDVVVSNPPYIPDGAVPVDPEVAEHDPGIALYGRSADGLAVPVAVAASAALLLRPGGLLVMEHADTQGESLPRAIAATGLWSEVDDVDDLTGRPRMTRARRLP
ncbi:peptide chain release factor N(5)-glutamine methyltransferase [Janibacter sp. Y6]|uniref:peptide chain release factor N(5)-glutamine methyltransferase n=1 Tax=Janibacter sp. Y6 TaxID=2913552 RepID=UPI0034A5B198